MNDDHLIAPTVVFFLETLRQRRAAQGHHAPRDCQYFIPPRDKPYEKRCAKCDVYMCYETDMPDDLLKDVCAAVDDLGSFVAKVDESYYRRLNDLAIDLQQKVVSLEAEVDTLRLKASRVNAHAEKRLRIAVERLRLVEKWIAESGCHLDDATRDALIKLDFDMMQSSLRIQSIIKDQGECPAKIVVETTPGASPAPVDRAPVGTEKDWFFKSDGWLGRKPVGCFVNLGGPVKNCTSEECPNGCHACQEDKKDG